MNGYAPIIEVALGRGVFWSIPSEMSAALCEQKESGGDAVYTWDWGDTRVGSWVRDGEPTSVTRYMIDFEAMTQTNLDSERKRAIRIIWVKPTEADLQ